MRDCFIRTNVERKIASSETTTVRSRNGYLSHGLIPGTRPTFSTIHTAKTTACAITNVRLPEKSAIRSTIRSAKPRRFLNSSSSFAILAMFCRMGSARLSVRGPIRTPNRKRLSEVYSGTQFWCAEALIAQAHEKHAEQNQREPQNLLSGQRFI